jgi:uncharacterized protein (TIGR02996 family)
MEESPAEALNMPMTTDEEALLAAVAAAPEDDAPRLVYADWLQERGADARAEYLRSVARLIQAPNDPAAVACCVSLGGSIEPEWRQRVGGRFEVVAEGATQWLLLAHLLRAVIDLAQREPPDLWQTGKPVRLRSGLTREDAEQFVRTFEPGLIPADETGQQQLTLSVRAMVQEPPVRVLAPSAGGKG